MMRDEEWDDAMRAAARAEREAERERLKAMTLSEAEARLSNAVYKEALFLEQLECVGSVRGNGHHAAQKIAAFAVEDLRSRWQGPR